MRSEKDLKPRVPYALTLTNIPGAFASPPLPREFDVQTASPSPLLKLGLLWRRPTEEDPPALQAAWERVFSREWRSEDRIVPHLEPQIGVTHNLRRPAQGGDGRYTSGQWAGAVTQGKWTSVIGYWVIPRVYPPNGAPFQPQRTRILS